MVKTLVAFTDEIDDLDLAITQIKERLDLGELLTNSVGLISCLPVYVESGVFKAVCDALPFDVAGITTIGTTVPGTEELTPLTLTVLTSDDATFKTAWTAPVSTEDDAVVKDSFSATLGGSPERPKLILAYAPLLMNVGGDFYNRVIDEVSGGVPCFGALAVDDTPDYHNSRVLYNGEAAADRLAYVIVYGAVEPRFYLATISQKKISKDKGVVTKSQGVRLEEINNKPVNEFLIGQGLKLNAEGVFEGINSFPYIVDFNDGAATVVRVMIASMPDGTVVCGGSIPEGAVLSVGYFDRNEILDSTEDAVRKIKTESDTQGLLIYSCIGRYFNLDYGPDDEARLVRETLNAVGVPFQLSYGAGEFCQIPTTDDAKSLVNRYHNCTLVACVL